MFRSSGKWQPEQVVCHEEWQVKHSIFCEGWARLAAEESPFPVLPSLSTSLARAAASLYPELAGFSESTTCLTVHWSLGSVLECWMMLPSFSSNQASPEGVVTSFRAWPPLRPLVTSVARLSIDPWQSSQRISMASVICAYVLPSPCMSCEVWQSTHCRPFSKWMSFRCTAFLNLSGSSSRTMLFLAS